jgi:putative transposase
MVAIRLEELIHEICKKLEIKVLILEIKPNYVHVFLDCPPTLSPHQVIHRLKGYSARHLRQEFEQLLVLPSMWTRFYLVSTEEIVSHETIKDYLKNKSQKA